jgi:hypothetical protein
MRITSGFELKYFPLPHPTSQTNEPVELNQVPKPKPNPKLKLKPNPNSKPKAEQKSNPRP